MKTKNLKSRLAVLLLSTLWLLTSAHAQITPSADAFTNTADSTTNYGANVLLDVDGVTEISYIQFNLSSIPSGASVSQATLKLYVNAVTKAGSFNVDYVNGTWTESTIDASNAPTLGSAIVSSVALTTGDKNQYILINITPAVVAWLNGSQANDGIALVANSTFDASFDSKENTTTSHPAELDIVFAGGGTITGITTASGSGLTGGGTSGTLNLSLINTCSANQILQWSGTAWGCASAGTGTVTSIAAGTGLTASPNPITGSGTLRINTAVVPQLGAANTFTANQTVNGNVTATNLTATQTVSGGVVNTNASYNLGGTVFDYGNLDDGEVYLGFSGSGTLSQYDTAVGESALDAINSSGYANTAIGFLSLFNNTSGAQNTAIGIQAGATADKSALTGSLNTALGGFTYFSTGTISNSTAIGNYAEVSESNALVLGCVSGVNFCDAGVNVGIGTTAPSAPLHINGPAGAPPSSQPSSNNGLLLGSNGTSSYKWIQTYGGPLILNGVGNNVGVGTESPDTLLSVNGGADKPGGGSWGTFSDGRLKNLNGNFNSGLSQILRINPIRYRYKPDNAMGIRDADEHIGVVAQDVQRAIPEAVTENSKGYLLVNNDPIIWAMLNAIKEQQKEIKQQQQLLRAQTTAMRSLKAEVRETRESLRKVKAQVAAVQPMVVAAK
jgi:Chaperone of endosialidase/TGF-beta propeptide